MLLYTTLLLLLLTQLSHVVQPAPVKLETGQERAVGFGDLPLEVRDMILGQLDPEDYLNFVGVFPVWGMSCHQELRFLGRNAVGLSHLHAANYKLFRQASGLLVTLKILFARNLQTHIDGTRHLSTNKRAALFASRLTKISRVDDMGATRMLLLALSEHPDFFVIWHAPLATLTVHYFALMLQAVALGGDIDTLRRLVPELSTIHPSMTAGLLTWASLGSPPSLVEALAKSYLNAMPRPLKSSERAFVLCCAVLSDRSEVLDHLMRRFGDSSAMRGALLKKALDGGRLHTLGYLAAKLDHKPFRGHRVSHAALCLEKGMVLAARHGNLEAIRLVWWDPRSGGIRSSRFGIKASKIDPGKVLLSAAAAGQLPVVEFLLQKDQHQQHRWDYGDRAAWRISMALAKAAAGGHLPVVRFLSGLQSEALDLQVLAGESNALVKAAGNGHLDIVQFLLPTSSAGPCQTLWGEHSMRIALLSAARKGRVYVLRHFLQQRRNRQPIFAKANNAANNRLALEEAIKHNHYRTTAFLMKMKDGGFLFAGILDACMQLDLLSLAVAYKSRRVVRLLLRQNEEGEHIYPNISLAASFQPLLSQIISSEDIRTAEVLFHRNALGQFSHWNRMPGEFNFDTLKSAISRNKPKILGHFLQRDRHGQFIYPELEPEARREELLDAALETPRVDIFRAISDAFPHAREWMLWKGIARRERLAFALLSYALESHIQLCDAHYSTNLPSIPHPAITAVEANDYEALKFLLTSHRDGTPAFYGLFSTRAVVALFEAVNASGNRDMRRLLYEG